MKWQETIRALGGVAVFGQDVVSAVAFARKIEAGLPASVIVRLKRFTQLSDSDLTVLFPNRTLTNIHRSKKLSSEQSDRVVRVAGIAGLAQRVFGDSGIAREWLLAPNGALDRQAPLRYLRTDVGTKIVQDVLTRIDHGVYE